MRTREHDVYLYTGVENGKPIVTIDIVDTGHGVGGMSYVYRKPPQFNEALKRLSQWRNHSQIVPNENHYVIRTLGTLHRVREYLEKNGGLLRVLLNSPEPALS